MNPSSKQTSSNDIKAYPTIIKNDLGGTVQQIFIQCKQYTPSKKSKK